MYLSHINVHGRSIEELTGKQPLRGRSMFLEDAHHSTGVIDDTHFNTRRRRNPLAERPVTFHWDNRLDNNMDGNYASGWQQPRDAHAVGQQIIFSANQKAQHQQSYPQPRPQGRRPVGRYGSRPSTESTELLGGPSYKQTSTRAADMFKRAKDRVDQFTVDDEAISQESVQKAREGAGDEYDYAKSQKKGRPKSRPTVKPTPRPVSQPAQPATPESPYATGYGQQQPQWQQQPAQRPQQAPRQQAPIQQQAPRQQPAPRQQLAQPQSAMATTYGQPTPQSRPAPASRPVQQSTKGPQYDARTGKQRNQPLSPTGCTWNKDSATKRFHAGVQPYEKDYNPKPQGWASSYRDTFSDDEDSYDPFAPQKSPTFHTAPKLSLAKGGPLMRGTSYQDHNKSAKGWNPIGLEQQEAENLYNPNRPPMTSLAAAFEDPRPQYGGAPQRPQQQQQQRQQQQQQQQQHQQQRPPPQRVSSTPQHGAGSGAWSGMLESDDL